MCVQRPRKKDSTRSFDRKKKKERKKGDGPRGRKRPKDKREEKARTASLMNKEQEMEGVVGRKQSWTPNVMSPNSSIPSTDCSVLSCS